MYDRAREFYDHATGLYDRSACKLGGAGVAWVFVRAVGVVGAAGASEEAGVAGLP